MNVLFMRCKSCLSEFSYFWLDGLLIPRMVASACHAV